MEFFDVVDKDRKPLGYTKQRGMKLDECEYNVGVEIWVFNDNKLLMTKRSLNKSHPGEWEVPGGCSKSGETSIDTVIRELKEEIGISINNKQFVDVYVSNKIIDLDKVILHIDEV